MSNRWARPYACERCRDSRYVARYSSARQADLVKCDKCGLMETEEYEEFRRRRWADSQKPPEITLLDLTPEEFKTYELMRVQNPKASKMTVLSWTEARRYDPSKDEEFLTEAREAFRQWRNR